MLKRVLGGRRDLATHLAPLECAGREAVFGVVCCVYEVVGVMFEIVKGSINVLSWIGHIPETR